MNLKRKDLGYTEKVYIVQCEKLLEDTRGWDYFKWHGFVRLVVYLFFFNITM